MEINQNNITHYQITSMISLNSIKKTLILFLYILITNSSMAQSDIDIHLILSKMTLKEKIGQLNQVSARSNIETIKEAIKRGEIGSILNANAQLIDELQKLSVENSKLGIPLIFARDVIHGYRTIYPIPLGQAATFNPEIVKAGAKAAAIEASSEGIRWTFAPMIDISRDARWGRIAESLGEDPYLTTVLGVAMTEGFQGDDPSGKITVAACAKHFVGYGASEGGRDYNSTNIPERLLRNIYLPPFQAQVNAGVATFMTSFNDNDGIPMTGNLFTNRDILRNEWKYQGVIVTDWNAIKEMITHGFAHNLNEAAKKAILASADIDMMSFAYFEELESLTKENPEIMQLIDMAVLRVLNLKNKLGLFNNPYSRSNQRDVFYAPAHLDAAKQAADESVVLLKNKNQILPIGNNIKKVAVIGPMADAPHDQLGTWVFDSEKDKTRTPLNALKRLYGDKVTFHYEKAMKYTRDKSRDKFKNAIKLAKKTDMVLLFVGEESMLSGEAKCLADINLIGAQSQLVKEMVKTGKPVVMVVLAGRPLTIENEFNLCNAVLYAWHPGTMGGDAIADILFGKVNPSGKLPVTFPRHVGQIPIYYNHNNTGRPAPDNVKTLDHIDIPEPQTSLGHTSFYMDYGKHPFLPFGYGLSYTTFEFQNLNLSKQSIQINNDSLIVNCTLKNTGNFTGTEVVQLYTQDITGSTNRPVKELKKFERVQLKAGEMKNISFTLYPEDFAFYGIENKKIIEPGKMRLWISNSSNGGLDGSFEIKL